MMKKNIKIVVVLAIMLLLLSGCGGYDNIYDYAEGIAKSYGIDLKNISQNINNNLSQDDKAEETETAADEASENAVSENIVIIYTNDVHCGIDENIGYAGLIDYKNKMLEKTPYVTLVDCGDAIQGDLMGTVSRGEYIIDIMNGAGYEYAILGNHEFDYGLPRLSELIDKADYDYLGCNISYTGDGKNELEKLLPYAIKQYGDRAVAFIGVSTPYSITSSTPKYFMDDNGNLVYDFYKKDPEQFYGKVQECVDKCKSEGADHVVLLAHLGSGSEFSPFSSTDVIKNTSGIDAVLDGHARYTTPCNIVEDKDGKNVLLSATGLKLQGFGQLVISEDGIISASLISSYEGRDEATTGFIDGIKAEYDEKANEVVAKSDTAMSCTNADGLRMTRNRETAIGNFCSDAYREISGADFAFVNGGGIRADLPSGDITYADVLAVHPFGNTLCMVEATGQEILDALEFATRKVQAEFEDGGIPLGESGGFLQVSGLKFTIDTSVEPSITTDEDGMFVSVDGDYRVKDVEIMDENGEYVPLDLEKTYTVASHSYSIKNSGDGLSVFADNELLIDEGMADYQMLITYITDTLDGNLSRYSKTEGRITVE